MQERIQKILSARGIASRRKAEEYILQGLVRVNGKVATLGQKADAVADKIEVDGKVLSDRQEMLYYVMNKPVGVETTNLVPPGIQGIQRNQRNQGFGRKGTSLDSLDSLVSSVSLSVRDLLPLNLRGKIYPVGRLDKDSCGLLLFTNDGVLAYRLTHPKFQHDKEYEVVLDRPIDNIAIKKLQTGFMLDEYMTKPMQVAKGQGTTIYIILTEGRNRQIRRMCQYVGYTVKELKRIRIMTLRDERIKPGTVRALNPMEKKQLLKSVGL